MDQRKTLSEDKTQADWWKICDRGDWLIWQLQQLPAGDFNKIKPQLLKATNKIADRAVTNHALNCGIKEVEQWAKKWLSGEDRSERAATEIALTIWSTVVEKAAWSAARAAGAKAIWLVGGAEAAAEAAGPAARAEQKQQAEDIRELIPEWPGKI
jgi:hypothetical protein